MQPAPLYQPTADGGAYQLRYAWTGWPSAGSINVRPQTLIADIKPLWERDGLHVLEYRWTESMIQIVFSATPVASPEFVAARAKGRFDHALRRAKIDAPFSRKTAIRSIGDNTRRDLETYLTRQVVKEQFIDPRFAQALDEMSVSVPDVDLSQPAESARGRYWYDLHLVLTVAGHARILEISTLRTLRDSFFRIANKKGHVVAQLTVMPDHLHAMLRPQTRESPLEVVFAYQNNLAHMLAKGRIWADGYFVGNFGEYSMQVVRNNAD